MDDRVDMTSPIASSGSRPASAPTARACRWWQRNQALLGTATLLFAANQLFELFFWRINHVAVASWCKYDCNWYRSILEQGYHLTPAGPALNNAANWAFFPAFPLLAKILALAGLSDGLALMVTSRVLFLLSLYLFMKFAQAYSTRVSPLLAGAVVAFSPWAVYAGTGYTESLYLCLTCGAFCALRRDNLVVAGLVGAGLGATRFVGAAFGFSFLAHLVRRKFWTWRPAAISRAVFALGLVPLGLALFSLYLYWLMGDGLAFMHIQHAWGREVGSVLENISNGLRSGGSQWVFAVTTLAGVGASLILLVQRRYELGLFALLAVLIPASTSMASMPRYVMWQAPVLLLLAEAVSLRRAWVLYFPLSILGLSHIYTLWAMRNGFVI
jgi:hypothetical protein